MKNKFPGVLWLLPIFFGVFGGVVAALIANLKYEASWWELLVAGMVISFLITGSYLIYVFMLLVPLMTLY